MRSRYSAYVVQDVDYVMKTHSSETIDTVDREGAAVWSREAEWLGLTIISTDKGQTGDDEGTVEFVAQYSLNGELHSHHEKSRFVREQGAWAYIDGEMVKPAPMVRSMPKVGRNEPCPCGSGKKYKKCCGKLG